MPGIRVITDSSCDLPQQLVDQLGVEIVPLTIRFGSDEFVDRFELSTKEFWEKVRTASVLPETAAPAPGRFEEAFRKAATEGADGAVCITLASDLSATYQSAELAAKSVADTIPVRVIDSKSLTMGLGLMVIHAARAAQAGGALDEVESAGRDFVGRMEVYGALDTLENLRKGGRIGSAQALLGSMLSIKPIIRVSTGHVEEESKQRTRSRALRYLVDKVRKEPVVEHLAVMHGDAPDIDDFLDLIGEVFPRERIVVGDIGPVIGTHAGPRVVGVTYVVPRR